MDHIREAVLKARDRRGEAGIGGAMRQSGGQTVIDVSRLEMAQCNFDAFGRNRIISNEHDPVLNAYRVLRTRVLQKMDAEGWRSLAVVSPAPGAGKTVTAINLAIAIASSEGSRTILADFDFYRPSVARYLGVNDPGSVLDYFEGERSLMDVTRRTDVPDVLLMANERVSRRGAEFFSSARTDRLIDNALDGFGARILVMDTSPILGCDDTIALLPKIDCVLLVAASGQTKASDLKEAQRLLKNTNVVGTILNMAPASSETANYYYY